MLFSPPRNHIHHNYVIHRIIHFFIGIIQEDEDAIPQKNDAVARSQSDWLSHSRRPTQNAHIHTKMPLFLPH
jgi:hypothetical protein